MINKNISQVDQEVCGAFPFLIYEKNKNKKKKSNRLLVRDEK